ncbi:MAG: high-affinity branched-chain amino acid ABC transporter ATP-binding protein LivG [Deltaproteobacteria bacterium]|nr:MAG: high-affinity branched-chain amino acid ABC transporter ATP-binding protein LivG [Deltaproteobacteria bacterium]
MSLLEVDNLTQLFSGLCAVSELKLALEERELVGLIGPNGAGKTTVFNIVSGFYQPTHGEIRFQGRNLAGLKPHQVSALGITRTFQNIRLWKEMSVLDNILVAQHYHLGYGLGGLFFRTPRYLKREKDIRIRAFELLEIFKIDQFADEKPTNLPYGMQRKVEIVRALSSGPKLLLLDEPAAGLQATDVSELITLIQWVFDQFDLSIWMIEHQMKVVMSLCSQISVIDFGKLIASGTPEEIQNNPEVIKAYLGDDQL